MNTIEKKPWIRRLSGKLFQPHQYGNTAVTASARESLRFKQLLSFLSYTKELKKEYFLFFTFLSLQMGTYQLLAYSVKFLINNLMPRKTVTPLVLFALCWIGMFVIHGLFTLVAAKFRIIIVRTLVAHIRSEIIRRMQVLSIKYFDTRGTGATSAKLLMDVDRMQGFFEWVLNSLMTAVVGIILIIPILSTIDPLLTLLTVLYVPTIPILQRIFQNMLMKHSYKLRNTTARLSEKIVDYIAGIKQIRIFANEEEQGSRIIDEVNSVKDVDIKYTMIMRNFRMAIQFFSDFMPIMIWVAAGILMIHNTALTLGGVVAYVTLVRQFLGSVDVLFSSFDQTVLASPSVKAILEILKNDEIENPCPSVREFTIDGSIRFEHVNFSYETRVGQRQLTDVCLNIKPGQKVAFVGESGSGKSTLVNVLMGLYPIQSGKILYGSHDLSTLSYKKLRSQIAIMTQDVFLFNTTLIENIRFANLDATTGMIEDACRKAQIFDFIKSLPDGLNTFAGERGVQLSGGQRQRIGLARVFLRNPKIIILDEPSSALDVFTEQRLFDTLFQNIGSVTLIVIAHRLSTIKKVDHIFVFSNGRIIEEGEFERLSVGDGLFSEMVRANNASR